MNIVLVGMMGVGKSSVGRILAREMGWRLVDTDQVVVENAGMAIPAIFAAEGEAGFRSREAEAISVVAARDGQVIATGGGAVLAPANREALRRSGLVFWLDAPPDELYRRARAQGVESRPLLSGSDPLGRLTTLADSRAEAYRQAAHHRVETGGKPPDAVAQEILAILSREEYQTGT